MVPLPRASYYSAYTYGAVGAGLPKYFREKWSKISQAEARQAVPFPLLLNHLLRMDAALARGRRAGALRLACTRPPAMTGGAHISPPAPRNSIFGQIPSDALLVAAEEMLRDLKHEPEFSSSVLPTHGVVEELRSRTLKEKYSPVEVIWKRTKVLRPNRPCIYLQILQIAQKERAG